jgi:hypothetical protein
VLLSLLESVAYDPLLAGKGRENQENQEGQVDIGEKKQRQQLRGQRRNVKGGRRGPGEGSMKPKE